MMYVALLRGINVGGNNKVEMPKLKLVFEKLGYQKVKTYINSGNVVFMAHPSSEVTMRKVIEAALEQNFGFRVSVLLRDFDDIKQLVNIIPATWVNDQQTKCDVMFLWEEIDSPNILEQLPIKPELEDVKYFTGTVIWRIDRHKLGQSRMSRLVGTDVYKKITIRNPNTVRKLYELMQT